MKKRAIFTTSGSAEVRQPDWERRADAALSWIRRSMEATGGQGSAHSWSPVFGWAKAYPETTGYLVETLLDYAGLKQDASLRSLATGGLVWLKNLQMPGGAFPGLLAGHTRPSVFNTAMILFGLTAGLSLPAGEGTDTALNRAVSWLLGQLEPDFSWRKHAYVPGFTPSYYTRAVWGVLHANRTLQNPEVETAMRHALYFYESRILPNGAVRDWGFRPGEPAFTHTIGYTLEGFLESALVLQEKRLLEKIILAGDNLLEVHDEYGRAAGRYDEHWRGDYSFRCPTGNCQLSVFYHRLWETTGTARYREAAGAFLKEVLEYQNLGKNRNAYGALPGSVPFWGPYLRFRYPNWGVKFFLDAVKKQAFS